MYVLDSESLKKAKITQTLIIINSICFLAFNVVLPIDFILQLVQINDRITNNEEYYRLLTSMFLHADIMHIFSNMVALLFFGTAVENNYSKFEYIIIYFISGLIGNLFSLLLLPPETISLGASGAIFGLIGAAFILFTIDGDKTLIFLGLLYLLIFIISSLAPGINLWAHLFGLIGGLIFGYIFIRRKKVVYEY
ncbi:MAG: rhomboid family intramembrane serine protease [Promethearchaeota archaeon]|nr:MAG: rhomboid family intramembrane serine protease [Candidatus Lokiarchaeota archaeon]